MPILDPPLHLYSAQGAYLGPSSTEVPTTYEVQDHRSTRSFHTRQVIAFQEIANSRTGKKEKRKILVVLMDWHVLEPFHLLEYSIPTLYPISSYSTPEKLLPQSEYLKQNLSPKMAKIYSETFHLFGSFFDNRPCPISMGAQNSYGFKEGAKTTEDEKHPTNRTNSYWLKVHEQLEGPIEQTAAMG